MPDLKISPRKIGITGVSSFTGLWIADQLARQQHEVHGLLTKSAECYSGLQKLRLERLPPNVQLHSAVDAVDSTMAAWIALHQPEVWIHHHHFMEVFRSPQYDVERATKVGIEPLPVLVDRLSAGGCRLVVFSGTYLEPGEGGPFAVSPTPYSISKQAVWLKLKDLCNARKIQLAKVVIPNPIGPFENTDRLIPNLIRHSIAQTPFRVMTPLNKADNVPINHLVTAYSRCVMDPLEQDLTGRSQDPALILRPSLGAESNRDFIVKVVKELIVKRLGLPPPLIEYMPQDAGITRLVNRPHSLESEGATESLQDQESAGEYRWDLFWDFYASEIKKSPSLFAP